MRGWDMLAAVFIVAVIFMLVRPGSPASQAVNDVSNALSSLILTATGAPSSPTGNPGNIATSNPSGTFSA